MARRRFLAVEVVQSSGMDCGPAALRSLLEGHGVHASYGRLREACQTDVDGTSINTLEDIAVSLGLDAHQTMVPVDALLLSSAHTLPALIVMRQPSGATHFVVLWQCVGPLVQVMDPAIGRRWMTRAQFLRDVFVHEQPLPAAAWRRWAGGDQSRAMFRERLATLGLETAAEATLDAALADDSWRGPATLDAALRMTQALVDARAVRRGAQALALVRHFTATPAALPPHVWSVSDMPRDAVGKGDAAAPDGSTVYLRGAVFIRVSGTRERSATLAPELQAALNEGPARPLRTLIDLLRADGTLTPAVVSLAMVVAAGATMVEAVLLRGLFDLGRDLQLFGQRLGAYTAIVVFATGLLLLEVPVAAGLLRLGRQLENRLRMRFLEKIPRLGDRYFQSRPKSDMAERSHALHRLRHLPEIGGRVLRALFELLFTTLGIIWLDPASAPVAVAALAAAVLLPLIVQPTLAEHDMRLRTHAGALGRFYLDAMLGLVAIRTHGSSGPVRQAQRGLLGEWAQAGLAFQQTVAFTEGAQLALGFGFAGWLVVGQFSRAGDTGSALLLVYWALSMPSVAQDLALAAWQYPSLRSITLRLVEPLGAIDDSGGADRAPAPDVTDASLAVAGLRLALDDVSVRAGGHTVLSQVTLSIAAGEHVAVVGRSGAGKSSLVGLLLGWHRPASGRVRVDDVELDGAMLSRVRAQTAWVDPEVHLWNRSMLDNLAYGSGHDTLDTVGTAIEQSDLLAVLDRLPGGLQAPLGEAGARLSGGEGQRVRLARAMLRPDARLVILDEPFRGLERERRAALLARCRDYWKQATLICITHDVAHTRSFERVLVVDAGRLVQDGPPAVLESEPESLYRAMLDRETALHTTLWTSASWRRVRVAHGQAVDVAAVEGRS